MWRDYAIRYIKHNQVTSIFLAGITFLSSILLSLVCGVFYNLWIDHVHRQVLKTGMAPSVTEPVVIAYLFVLLAICASLVAMIHNAFEVSMNSRIHQLGILKSVGATPKQIRGFLLQEVFLLCAFPAAAGVLAGWGLCYGFLHFILTVTDSTRTYEVIIQYHWGIGVVSYLLSMITVLLSAWIPARRISRLTPLWAIHAGAEVSAGRMKHFRVFSRVFGIYGELARKSLYARRKALRTSTCSLMLAILAFVSFLNLEVISGISTQKTYFERFRNVWDVMFTAEDVQNQDLELLAEIRAMEGVESCIAYQKFVAETEPEHDAHQTLVYVLDDESFERYCASQGADESRPVVAADAAAFPEIREDFVRDSRSVILSRNLYRTMAGNDLNDTVSYNIKTISDSDSQAVCNALERILPERSRYTLESRLEREVSDRSIRNAMKFVIGALAGLLACIGITNVFSSVLGQIYQRRKEFARYVSAGMSPKGMRKILFMETLIISLQPLVISLLLNIPVVILALRSARLSVGAFIPKAPIVPTLVFAALVLMTVGLAYCLGGRYICRGDLVELLKDETMV